SGDQEALTKLFAGKDKSEKAGEATEDIQNEKQDTEESGSKKRKLSMSEVNITFSVSDVKSTYKDATLLPKWKAFQTVIFLEGDDGLQDSSPNAWSLMYPLIPDKLQTLYNDGYKLVIFTNESNTDRWKNQRQKAVDSKIGRLNQFIEKVKVPIQVFITRGTGGKSGKAGTKEADPFRKPKPQWGTAVVSAVNCSQPLQRSSVSDGRFPSSPSDTCHSADLRRAALLRSVQMRTHPPGSASLELPFGSGQEPSPNIDSVERPCSCMKSLSGDQEALTKLFAGKDKSEKAGEATEDIQNEKQDTEESGSKKRKLSMSEVNITFSVSDVKSTYKDATLLPKWKAFQTVIFLEGDDGLQDSSPNAWSLMYPLIPDKLQTLYNDGYKLVIFTNESNTDRWKNQRQKAVDSKIGRLNQFIEKVKVPIQVFITRGTGGKSGKAGTKEADPFRKPKPQWGTAV
ncbi:hypothetical protein RYX36_020464, partial [Vicia faba]